MFEFSVNKYMKKKINDKRRISTFVLAFMSSTNCVVHLFIRNARNNMGTRGTRK
jgi:hypothetical protein